MDLIIIDIMREEKSNFIKINFEMGYSTLFNIRDIINREGNKNKTGNQINLINIVNFKDNAEKII